MLLVVVVKMVVVCSRRRSRSSGSSTSPNKKLWLEECSRTGWHSSTEVLKQTVAAIHWSKRVSDHEVDILKPCQVRTGKV